MKSFDYRLILAQTVIRITKFVDDLGFIIVAYYAGTIAVSLIIAFGMLCGVHPPPQSASSVVVHNIWVAIKIATLLTFLTYLGYEIRTLTLRAKGWAKEYERNKRLD